MEKKQPNPDFIISILEVIKQNKSASAKKIFGSIKRLRECNKSSITIPYSTIARLLRGYLFERGYVKPDYKSHLPPSKEIFYKLTSEGKEFLEGNKVESLDDMDIIMHPRNCIHDCDMKQVEECWDQQLDWIERYFKVKLSQDKKTKLKEIFQMPVKIMQIELYYNLMKSIEKEIKPFFSKNLLPKAEKMHEIIGKQAY